MRAQRFGRWPVRPVFVALLIALMTLPLAPAQPVDAAPVVQTDAEIANRVAEIRSDDPDIEDNFDTDEETWGRMYTGVSSVYFKSGKLHVSTDQTEQIVWSRRDGSVTDFYLEVEAEVYEGAQGIETGVIFRYVDENNFYYFGVDDSGNYVIQRLSDGTWSDVIGWDTSSVIETGTGAVNQLGLLVEGTTISVLINDYVLATAEDDSFSEGSIALSAVSYTTPGVDMAYDNFRLWALNGAVTGLPARVPQRPSSQTPTPTPEATPTGTAQDDTAATTDAGDPTYVETFDQEPEGWTPLIADDLEYAVEDGALRIGITRANALGWTVLPIAPNNYYLAVDTTFFGEVTEAEFGILFRYQDPQNFYLFAVNNNGYYSLWRLLDNSWEELYAWTESDALSVGDGAANLLELVVVDDTFGLFANSVELATVQDAIFAGGSLAFAAGTFDEANIDVVFDNVMLWSLDPEADITGRSEGPEVGAPPIAPLPDATVVPEMEPTPESVPTSAPEEEGASTAGDLPSLDEANARVTQVMDEQQPAAQDDFNRDRGNWQVRTNDTSRTFLEDNALQIEISEANWYQWSGYMGGGADLVDFSDFYAEVTTFFPTSQPDAAAGIAFRLIDAENYYLFVVTEAGRYALFVQTDGEWTTLIDYASSDAYQTGADALNLIGVLAEGDTIALTINAQVVDVVQDATHSSGAFALVGQSADTPGVVVGFDDFALWEAE